MKFILGTKQYMTQLFMEDGRVIPVTVVRAGRNVITQVKHEDRDGYSAIQIGTQTKKKNINKPQRGHTKGLPPCSVFRELRLTPAQMNNHYKPGVEFGVEVFRPGDTVRAMGVSKGHGFQGVVKRHGFSGAPKTHGTKDQLRMPGSIGAGGPQHVFKGRRMPGRMGNDHITIKGLQVVKVDSEHGLLYIKGALPGAFNSLIVLSGPGTFKIHRAKEKYRQSSDTTATDENSNTTTISG